MKSRRSWRPETRGRFDSVIAWTVNDETQLLELMALGVNGIITDNPALLRHLVETSQSYAPWP